MNASHDKVRREMKEAMAQLRALRDEAALKIHLAGMDAKKTWDQLQPKLAEAEKGARERMITTRSSGDRLANARYAAQPTVGGAGLRVWKRARSSAAVPGNQLLPGSVVAQRYLRPAAPIVLPDSIIPVSY